MAEDKTASPFPPPSLSGVQSDGDSMQESAPNHPIIQEEELESSPKSQNQVEIAGKTGGRKCPKWQVIVFIIIHSLAFLFVFALNPLMILWTPLAIIPAVIYLLVLYFWKYFGELEIIHLINFWLVGLLCYIFGMLFEGLVSPSIGFQYLSHLNDASFLNKLSIPSSMAFGMAALMEEFLKFCAASLAVLLLPQERKRPWFVMLLGVTATLSFATIENISYLIEYSYPAGLLQVSVRDVLSVPLHFTTALVISSLVSFLHFCPSLKMDFFSIWLWAPVILFPSILIHGAFDWILMLQGFSSVMVFVLQFTIIPTLCVMCYVIQVFTLLLMHKFDQSFMVFAASGSVAASSLEFTSVDVDISININE